MFTFKGVRSYWKIEEGVTTGKRWGFKIERRMATGKMKEKENGDEDLRGRRSERMSRRVRSWKGNSRLRNKWIRLRNRRKPKKNIGKQDFVDKMMHERDRKKKGSILQKRMRKKMEKRKVRAALGRARGRRGCGRG